MKETTRSTCTYIDCVDITVIVTVIIVHNYRVYSNRMQAKKIITILTFARLSGNGSSLDTLRYTTKILECEFSRVN